MVMDFQLQHRVRSRLIFFVVSSSTNSFYQIGLDSSTLLLRNIVKYLHEITRAHLNAHIKYFVCE
jgi:hypothetical protein